MSADEMSHRVVRVSTTTGRVLRVLTTCSTRREAELFAEGFGKDASPKTRITIQPCTPMGGKR